MIALGDRSSLDQRTVSMLVNALGYLQAAVLELGSVDITYGQAQLGSMSKCIWLADGRRVTVEMSPDGGLCAGVSKDPDPEALRD